MSERDSLDMSTDNTAEGETYSDTVVGGPISKVWVGDKVVDATGKEVGKVKFAKMGDPNAATTEGQWGYSEGFLGLWGDDYDIGQLPAQAQGQLMRVGFIHIDIPWAGDKFAGAGMIDRVEGNTVYLNVPESALI
jgi:hypothetical protein